uniref:G protein-coupled receptor n=1 Tax=Haemonchus contortus TaxID=6289 RepID=A0A7I4Y082_HAECO
TMLVTPLNGLTLFVPVIFPGETLEIYPSFRILYATELIFILVSLPGAFLLIRVLGRSVRLFHENLIKIMQVHLLAVTVSEASRILAILYETRIIERSEDNFDVVVFVTVAVRTASLCPLLTMIPAMITERSFASRFISNYEKLPRYWISFLINGISIVLSVSYYVLAMLACMSTFFLLVMILISVLIMTLSCVAIIMVHRKDVAILRDLTNKTGVSTVTYTLSLKFQLEENVRVTRLLMFLSVGYSVWGFFGCGFFSSAFIIFDPTDPLGQLFYALFNNYTALSLAILVWWLLWTIGDLRRMLRTRFASCCGILKMNVEQPSVVSKENVHRIDDHFNQLQAAWAP